MINVEMLEYIFTMVKRIKKPIVKIFPNGVVIGTDEQFATLNIITSEVGMELPCPFVIDTKEITAFMREVSKDYEYYKPVLDFPHRFITTCKKDLLILNNHIEMNYRIDELYNRVISQELCKPTIHVIENIQETIPEMISLKSSDGAKMYNIDKGILMSSFNAIHPATKTDKVTVVIRDSDIYSYTAEFIIHKKKDNYQLHEILRFRKL